MGLARVFVALRITRFAVQGKLPKPVVIPTSKWFCSQRHRTFHRFRRRNLPPGYTEMLERQHAQLVSCVQELYQRARKAGPWDPLPPEDLKRYPSVNDILAALDLLEPKDDGRRDFETFHEIVGPTQSDNDTPASVLDGVTEGQDHHDSTPDQSKSP